MKLYEYTGTFISAEGHRYELICYCNGFIQAFFLLTAEAIQSGKHYQLSSIMHENGSMVTIDDILKVSSLIKNV